ncbi:hypothetical protein DM02DRAFT_365079 [Periconia macrospinosa]|uniref:Uncharacterized protein n=1 Tax=Periconia macrospinosa TaxID=97972 RepID=A0A2V1DV34_9PLEO|nr:hypothetical protein DM02DRAFT_365079 [Periconia macrospinosa]
MLLRRLLRLPGKWLEIIRRAFSPCGCLGRVVCGRGDLELVVCVAACHAASGVSVVPVFPCGGRWRRCNLYSASARLGLLARFARLVCMFGLLARLARLVYETWQGCSVCNRDTADASPRPFCPPTSLNGPDIAPPTATTPHIQPCLRSGGERVSVPWSPLKPTPTLDAARFTIPSGDERWDFSTPPLQGKTAVATEEPQQAPPAPTWLFELCARQTFIDAIRGVVAEMASEAVANLDSELSQRLVEKAESTPPSCKARTFSNQRCAHPAVCVPIALGSSKPPEDEPPEDKPPTRCGYHALLRYDYDDGRLSELEVDFWSQQGMSFEKWRDEFIREADIPSPTPPGPSAEPSSSSTSDQRGQGETADDGDAPADRQQETRLVLSRLEVSGGVGACEG